jgi:hypothetical protein
MSKQNKSITKYWLKHYIDKGTGLCSLCGNTGIIILNDVRNPSGELLKSAHADFCICPNGQALRNNDDFE